MPNYELTANISNLGSRNDVRMRVVQIFSLECPGTGTGELASKYRYHVETLSDGKIIIVKRPAYLKGGFDFVVSLPEHNFSPANARRRYEPKHDDIIQDLVLKRAANPNGFAALFLILEDIYECRDVTDAQIAGLPRLPGLTSDLIIKVLKWLFIEQDIRYWNYSGRGKLWESLPRP